MLYQPPVYTKTPAGGKASVGPRSASARGGPPAARGKRSVYGGRLPTKLVFIIGATVLTWIEVTSQFISTINENLKRNITKRAFKEKVLMKDLKGLIIDCKRS